MTPKEIAAAALAVIVVIIAAAAWRWLRPRYEWCEHCAVWCHDRDDPCECCELELDDGQADELRSSEPGPKLAAAAWLRGILGLFRDVMESAPADRIGAYDDGEPVTGELYGPADNPFRIRPYLPVEVIDPDDDDEAWPAELAELNRARRSGELDELSLEHTDTRRLYLDLSSDPDLIEWDAKRQAARTWEIAYLEFPALRARLAAEYAAAADDCRDYFGRRMVAA